MKKYLLLLLALFSFQLSAQLRLLQVDDFEDYEIALKTVRQNHHLIFAAVHDGSGTLLKMYNDGVFNDAQVLSAAKPYTALAIDASKPMGERFASLFKLAELPSFYIMNEQEFVLDVLSGYQSAADLSKALAKAAQAPFRYDSLLIGYQAHTLTDAEWIELLELYALNFDFRATTRLAQEYLNTKSEAELLHPPVATLLSQYGLNLETIYPTLVISRASVLESKLPDFDLQAFLYAAIDFNLDLAIVSEDSLLCETICETLVIPALASSADSLEILKLNIRREFAWQSGHFGLYAQAFKKQADRKNPGMAATELFEEAYEIVENFNENSALKAAFQLAQASDDKENSFRARMLKAYIAYLQKDQSQAQSLLQAARAQIKNPEQLRSLEKLQGLVNEAQAEK